MKMKRIISGLLAASLVFLAGCQADIPDPTEPTGTPEPNLLDRTEETFPIPEDYPVYSGKWQPSDEPLTVYVSALYNTGCKSLQSAVEYLAGQPVEINWVFLPGDSTEANVMLTKMHTDMMAGKGPDMFLAACPGPFAIDPDSMEPVSRFFQNPEKTMRLDTFLPLDGLLENAQYMDVDGLTKAVLSAGRTQAGQVVLPLAYTYNAVEFRTADLSDPASLPTSWEGLSKDSALNFGRALVQGLCSAPGRMADYSSEEILFTEDDLLAWTQAAYDAAYAHSGTQETGAAEVRKSEFVGTDFPGGQTIKNTFLPLWNTDGGVTAIISSFAAVNKNTAQANNAMFLLDVLCSPQVLSGQGFEGEMNGHPRWYGNMVDLTPYHVPIDKSALKYAQATAVLDEFDSKINAVRFFSNLDRVFFDLAMIRWGSEGEPSDLDIQIAVSNAYDTLQMIISE